MGLDRSRAVLPRLVVADRTGSTNADLLAAAADEPHLSALATLDQTAGRGRLGRRWEAPPGRTLAASVLLDVRPTGTRPLPVGALGWVPLLAGVALAEAVAPLVPGADVGLKWPNDVLLGGEKACGLLAEVTAGGSVVVGAGVDLVLSRDELPTPTATSLALHGAAGTAEELADRVLAAWVPRLDELLAALVAAGGDARGAGAHALATRWCASLGRAVEVHLPDGRRVTGTATALADDGRLCVGVPGGEDLVVGSGDVVHLRHGATP